VWRARSGPPLAAGWQPGQGREAWLLERGLRRPLGASGRRVKGERRATWGRPWPRRQDELPPRMTGVQPWPPALWPAWLPVLVARPRRRQLQRLPVEVTLGLHGANTRFQPPQLQDIAARRPLTLAPMPSGGVDPIEPPAQSCAEQYCFFPARGEEM
jgi:hypothetical protein